MSEQLPVAFANPNATATLRLPGPCRCPGQPHEYDEATYRTELGDGELAALEPAGWFYSPVSGMYSAAAFLSALMAFATASWTISGEPDPETGERPMVPIEYASLALLDRDARDALSEAINGAYAARHPKPVGSRLPNAPGAPSPRRSRGSASQTRRTRARR